MIRTGDHGSRRKDTHISQCWDKALEAWCWPLRPFSLLCPPSMWTRWDMLSRCPSSNTWEDRVWAAMFTIQPSLLTCWKGLAAEKPCTITGRSILARDIYCIVNNVNSLRGRVAHSPLASALKLQYYRLFAWGYGIAGRAASCVMVNSSWTEEHIR